VNAMRSDDKSFLLKAIQKAKDSIAAGGFPAGAIIVRDDEVVGEGISIGDKLNDPTSHGDVAAIREACRKLHSADLSGAVLYTSLQPCMMCFGASVNSSISRIVFACSQVKVSPDYYGGRYLVSETSAELNRPLELVHFAELEDESLALIHEWEKATGHKA